MALVNGTNYDHIDLHAASGGDVTRHKLQDSEARAMIGPTEASSTASAAHPAGSYFIYNNKLYQATSDIASGGTITPNTNCKEAPLGGEVSDLKSAIVKIEGPATSADVGKSLIVKTVTNGIVSAWKYGEAVTLDDTLTQTGEAADAKATGDAIAAIEPGLSDDAKAALLVCLRHVAWIDDHGQDYYDDLYSALYRGPRPQIILPDLTTGSWERGYFWNEDGTEATSNYNIINRTYYAVEPETSYTWIQGFSSYIQSGETMLGEMCRYKICVYDSNKNFLSFISNNDEYTTSISHIEDRYFRFTTPQNAAYIRVSCLRWPVGFFATSIPDDIYCVVVCYEKTDGSNFVNADFPSVMSAISVYRNSENITLYAKTGQTNIQSIDNETYQYSRGEFAINSGGAPEGGPSTYSRAKYLLVHSMLLKAGDIITVNGLKVSIWAQKLTGGSTQHTTSWLTSGESFTVGGASI